MLQFHNETDRQLFLLEIGKRINEIDTEDDHNLFIKKRRKSISLLKDFLRRRRAERGWKTHRSSLLSAIKDYHKSNRGQEFHRKLGRFLALRVGFLRTGLSDYSAMEQLSFYMPIEQQAKLELLIDDFACGAKI